VLEDRRIMRVGGSELIDVDFRLIAATNKDLEKEVAANRFREDLYYRLKVVTLRIPPLRDRTDDIPLLAEHFLRIFCKEHGREAKRLSARAIDALKAYAWPGNVRELKNAMESVVVFHRGVEVGASDLPHEIRSATGIEEPRRETVPAEDAEAAPHDDGERTMADIEREAILTALDRTGGRRAEAAKLLDIGLRTLQRKLKEYKQQGFFQG